MKAHALKVPFREMTQKEFHDALATQCPALSKLSLSVIMPVEEWHVPCTEYLSSTLFSMPSITKLEISLGCLRDMTPRDAVNGMVFSKMIQNLSALTNLTIKTNGFFSNRKFLIISPTLINLDTTGLSKAVWVAVNCPALERFACKGGFFPFGSGTLPLLSAADFADMDSFKESFVDSHRLEVAAGRVPFKGLCVPDTCLCIVQQFDPPKNRVEMMESIDMVCTARFDMW